MKYMNKKIKALFEPTLRSKAGSPKCFGRISQLETSPMIDWLIRSEPTNQRPLVSN